MNRVLLTTYYFPPCPAVGSLRPSGLAKYLPECGWEATVLTPGLPDRPARQPHIIETEHGDGLAFLKGILGLDSEQNLMTQVAQLKKKLHIRAERSVLDFLLVRWAEIAAYPDAQKGWRTHAERAGSDFLRQERVDAILSTSSPPTSHIVARQLKQKHRIPWVADFRDLWTQNHFYPYSPLRRTFETRLEKRTLQEADAMVTVSEHARTKLSALHRGKSVHVIANGFDPDEVNNPCAGLTDMFTITYTGMTYPGRQSPEPLFAALRSLIAAGIVDAKDVEVRFYGAEAGWIDKQAERYGLLGIVKQFGVVPRGIALNKQRESQLLLLLKWNDPEERSVYTAKVFEYLAARRPILAVGGHDDVVSELLDETRAGSCGQTAEDVASVLGELYQEYRAAGKVGYNGEEDKVNRYSQRELARRFALVLDEVSASARSAD